MSNHYQDSKMWIDYYSITTISYFYDNCKSLKQTVSYYIFIRMVDQIDLLLSIYNASRDRKLIVYLTKRIWCQSSESCQDTLDDMGSYWLLINSSIENVLKLLKAKLYVTTLSCWKVSSENFVNYKRRYRVCPKSHDLFLKHYIFEN